MRPGNLNNPSRLPLRIVFVVYAVVLATGTHWPGLVIHVPTFKFTDKVVHFAAFGLWTLLFGLAGWIKDTKGSGRRLLTIGLIAGVYAGMDEWTQGLPGIMRTVSEGDFAANLIGMSVGVTTLAIIGRKRGGTTR